jgi:uncharacterized protein (UPF0333 family)
MKSNDLLIRQVIFDLTLNNEDQYSALNDTLVAFVNQRFNKIFQRVAQEFDPMENIFIEKLAIDLSENDLLDPEKTERLLYEKSLDYLRNVAKQSSKQGQNFKKPYTLLELLNFIADNGFLPWRFNTKTKVQQFFDEEIRKSNHQKELLFLINRNRISYLRVAKVLEANRFQKLMELILAKKYPLYSALIKIEDQIKIQKGNSSFVSFHEVAFYFLQQTSRSNKEITAILNKTASFIEKKYSMNQKEVKALFQIHPIIQLMKKEFTKKEILFSSGEKLHKNSFLKQLVELFKVIEKENGLRVLQGSDDNIALFGNNAFQAADLNDQIKSILQLYAKKGYSINDYNNIIYNHLILKTTLSNTEKKILDFLIYEFNFNRTHSRDKSYNNQLLENSYLNNPSKVNFKDWAELKGLFVQIENKGLLKKSTLQDLDNNTFLSGTTGNQTISAEKSLSLIAKFYRDQFNYTSTQVIEALYSLLIQKKNHTSLEVSLLISIGVLVFVKSKQKSLRKETVFVDSLKAIGKNKNQNYVKSYDRLKEQSSKPLKRDNIELIQKVIYKTLYSKPNVSENYLFKSVDLALIDINIKAEPRSLNISILKSKDWAELKGLFVQIENKGLLKKSTLQDLDNNTFLSGTTGNQTISAEKSLSLIAKFYRDQFNYTSTQVIEALYSLLIQKKNHTSLEVSLLISIGVLVFVKSKQKSLRKETVFVDSLKAIGKNKNQNYVKSYDRLKEQSSKPLKRDNIELIQKVIYKTLYSKPNVSENYLFKSVDLALIDINIKAEPRSLNISILKSKDWAELKGLFVQIENKGLLKKSTLQDLDNNTFLSGTTGNQTISAEKSLSLIAKFYRDQFNYTSTQVIEALYSLLIQKKNHTSLEVSLLISIGVLVFVKSKQKSLRKETVFVDSLKAIGKNKNQNYKKAYDAFQALLPNPKRNEHFEFLQALIFKILSSKTDISENYLFRTITLAIENIDNDALPFSVNNVNEEDFNEIKRKLYTKQTGELNRTTSNVGEEYFDFVLNLNNELLKKNESTRSDSRKKFISLKSILSSTKNLLSFLSAYPNEVRLLSNFSQVTLSKKFDIIFKSLLEKNYPIWIKIETELVDIQKELYFVDMTTQQFKSVLRHFLVKSLTNTKSDKEWSLGTFTYTFLLSIQTQMQVDIKKVKAYVQENILDIKSDIITGFEFFSTNDPFENIPINKTKQWYYKGLFYYYLEYNKIPFWANSETIENFEILKFLETLFNQKDEVFLQQLMSNNQAKKSLLNVIQNQTTQFYKNFLITLAGTEFHKEFKSFVDKEFRWVKKERVPPLKLVESLIQIEYWNIKSSHVFIESVLKQYSKDFPERKTISNKELKKSFVEKTLQPTINNIEPLLLYFLDNKKLPKTLSKEKHTILSTLEKNLDKSPNLAYKMFLLFLQKVSALNDERLMIFNKANVSEAIIFQFENKPHTTDFLIPFLSELDQQIADKVLFFKYIEILLKHLTQSKEDIRLSVTLTMYDLLKSKEALFEKITKVLIQEPTFQYWLTTSNIEKTNQKQTTQNNFATLLHFIEIGSLPLNQLDLSQKKLYNIIQKTPFLLVQKHLFNWAKEEEKRERFLKLFEPKSILPEVLKFVHVDLAELIIESNQIISKDSLDDKKTLHIALQKSYTHQALSLWTLQNFKLISPYPLLSEFIKTVLIQSKFELNQFVQLLEENPSKKTKLDKQTLRDLLAPKRVEKKEENYELLSEEPLGKKELRTGITIENAGLIIAWPFLSTLFSKMGLLEHNKIKNDASMQKAILATQYLERGAKEVEETQLVLNKILCGADIDFYVDTGISLDEIEISICDMALKSILGQWGKLKSIEALREYFFQRTGLLQSQEDGAFRLTIEKETRDILLRFIPWNLSIIKTTVMQDKLIIDWKYM